MTCPERKKTVFFCRKRAHLFFLKMRIVLSCCVLLPLAFSVWCQTNSILIGETSHPIIYNRTVDIAAANRPWYKSMISYFTRSEKPVQNVNYTFEPVSNTDLNRFFTYCVESNVKCNNFSVRSFFFLSLSLVPL